MGMWTTDRGAAARDDAWACCGCVLPRALKRRGGRGERTDGARGPPPRSPEGNHPITPVRVWRIPRIVWGNLDQLKFDLTAYSVSPRGRNSARLLQLDLREDPHEFTEADGDLPEFPVDLVEHHIGVAECLACHRVRWHSRPPRFVIAPWRPPRP